MDEEDDSGYERSTVTTSNSIFQTDLHQLVYQNLNNNNNNSDPNRPVNYYSNYESNYSSESLIIQTLPSNELRGPRSLNSSDLIASRPESSAYSTISSCSLNRQFNQQIDQDYPRLEEYQPLDQFKTVDNYHLLQERQNLQSTSDMSTNRSLNFQRNRTATSSPDYEQDWSAGEQDDDSDYIVDHVRQVNRREIEFSNASSPNLNRDRQYRRLLINDLEQNDNDIEEFNEQNQNFLDEKDEEEEDEDLENLDDDDDDDNSEHNINILVKDQKDNQLVNILNSPLDHSPFLTSPSLSLPSSSNSNDSNNSSPCSSSKRFKQKTKLKLPDSFSESSLESPKSQQSSPRSIRSFTSKFNNQPTKIADSDSNRSTTKSYIENNQPQPISEEEFTSRKKALRERINNTFLFLNNINNNCNRFRTITSRSKELLNQRRQAELEIDNIVQQNSNLNNITNNLQKQPPSERDLINSTKDWESEKMNKTQDKKQEVLETANNDGNASNIEKLVDRMDKTQNAKITGDTLNNLSELSKTIEFSKPLNLTSSTSSTSCTEIHKDTKPIDHFNNFNTLNLNKELPTPRTKPPIPQDFSNPNTSLTKSTIDTSGSHSKSSSKFITTKANESSIRDYGNQLSSAKNDAAKRRSSSITNLSVGVSELSENNKLKLSAISNSDTEQMKRSSISKDKSSSSKSTSSLKLDSKSDNSVKSDNLVSLSPRSSKNESRFSSLKSAKIRNNLKSNLNDIKSELNDLSDLLNIPTTSSSLSIDQVTKSSNNNLMSFVMQPKSVNTEIDSRLMDHILAKICAQREKELKENSSTVSNIPTASTSQTPDDNRPTTSTNNQQNKAKERLKMNDEKTESKHCQTDKVKNQDVSVSVNECDLESQISKKKSISIKKEDKKVDSTLKKSGNEIKEENESKIESCKVCESCKKKYSKELNDCEKEKTDNKLLNCCTERTQDAHRSSCSSIFHHLPVCINTCTFNHNTFTSSLPNLLHHSPISVLIEQGTNTEPDNTNESDQKPESSNKRDKQTQCILGLSLEQQQREYIKNQQQKYAKLKSELSKPNEFSKKRNESTIKKTSSNDFDKVREEESIKDKKEEKVKEMTKEEYVEKEQHKRETESMKKNESEDKEEENVIKHTAEDNKNEILSTKNDQKEDEKNLKVEQNSMSIETTPTKNADLSDSYEKKEIDLTLPIKLPFESQTSKLERKLLDGAKEKNVKTHSKIIIEFSGKSKRERSAVDSFTKLDKEGRLTKKTLVSNTKEILVPLNKIPIKITKEYLINPKGNETSKETTDETHNGSTVYPLSSTPQMENNQLTDQNSIAFYKNRNATQNTNSNEEWREASHSEIKNEMYADPLLNENKQAHPTRSITLSTITTFDQTDKNQPQRIDHSNKYQRCFENPSIYEPLIQSNFTMVEEPQIINRSNQDEENNDEDQLSSTNSSDENQVESEIKSDNDEIYSNNETKEKEQQSMQVGNVSNLTQNELEKRDYRTSSTESRSSESRLSNDPQNQFKQADYRNDEQEANVNSRSASRVSFNLPYNYKDSVDEESNSQANNMYLANSMESNLDQIDNFDPNKPSTSRPTITNLDSDKPAGLLETELDDYLYYENNEENVLQRPKNNENIEQQEREKERKSKKSSKSSSSKTKVKEKKSKSSSSKRKHHTSKAASDQSSSYSTANSQLRSTPKLNDSGFLSPEIYHSSPYELAYQQVNDKKDKKESKSDKKKSSSSKLDKKSKSLLKSNDLKFTEQKTNTEIITHLTKTSYPSNHQIDLNKLTSDSQKQIEKSLRNLKRNKVVLDQILNSPDFKPSGSKRSSQDRKKRSNCKISSQITMDLPIYKEERFEKLEKTVSCPLKSVSLEELDKERDLDHKSIVSQHSYSQQSGELFNTMTKFQRYKPSLSKSSKKNKSAVHLNQPDQWEYSMQCNCTKGPKANVLTNVKHRKMLYLPLQQYETSL